MAIGASAKRTAAVRVRLRRMVPRLYALTAVAELATADSGLLERLLAFPAGVEWIAREVMAILAAVPGSPSRLVWGWAEDAGAQALGSLAGMVRSRGDARRALIEASRARVAWAVRSTWRSRWSGMEVAGMPGQSVARFDPLGTGRTGYISLRCGPRQHGPSWCTLLRSLCPRLPASTAVGQQLCPFVLSQRPPLCCFCAAGGAGKCRGSLAR